MSKNVTVGPISFSGYIPVEIPEIDLHIDSDNYVFHGKGKVNLGRIEREGDGFTAYNSSGERIFTGDRFPRRTGKHTRDFALRVIVAHAAGLHDYYSIRPR